MRRPLLKEVVSYTLAGGTFTRTYTSAALSSYSVALLASQQSHFKVDGVALILLHPKGFLFVLQVDGTGSTPGRTLFEGYNFGWNRALEHSMMLTDKSGLFSTFSLSQALTAHGHTFTTLDALHAFVYAEPPPGPPRYWSIDNSEKMTQLVRKSMHNRSTLAEVAEEHLHVKATRGTQNNTYELGFQLSSGGGTLSPCTSIDLQGLYMEALGNNAFRIGVNALRPTRTLTGGSSVSVEASSSWSDPGASAVDSDGTPVQVTITGDTVDTSQLIGGTPYQIVYTAVSSAGDRNVVVRRFHVTDTTSPTMVLLPHSSGDINPPLDVGQAWVDPGYTVTPDGP